MGERLTAILPTLPISSSSVPGLRGRERFLKFSQADSNQGETMFGFSRKSSAIVQLGRNEKGFRSELTPIWNDSVYSILLRRDTKLQTRANLSLTFVEEGAESLMSCHLPKYLLKQIW